MGSIDLAAWTRRGLVIFFAVFVVAQVPDCSEAGSDLNRMRATLSRARSRIKTLRMDNARRAGRIERLKNSTDAIVDIARDEQGFVFPGELVLRTERPRP